MQKPAFRIALLALLLLTAFAAAAITTNIYRRTAAALEHERDMDARVDGMTQALAVIGAAQQAYLAPGQPQGEWFSRASSHLQQLYDDAAALRPRVRAPGAAAPLEEFGASLETLVKADAHAREYLRAADDLMAADVVYAEARPVVERMAETLGEVKQLERTAAAAESAALAAQGGRALGVTALLWIAGLVALVRLPAPREAAATEGARVLPVAEPAAPAPPPSPPSLPIDLVATARICTDLSRANTAAVLSDLLGRAARVLDAPGVVVWLGAGEELFVALAHGYDPKLLARLGPIRRTADNATAAAWRTGETRIVPSDVFQNGGIAAPLFGPAGAIGVLSCEVRSGRESDEGLRAVAEMLAAQLAAVVAAWPAPSTAEEPAPVAEERREAAL